MTNNTVTAQKPLSEANSNITKNNFANIKVQMEESNSKLSEAIISSDCNSKDDGSSVNGQSEFFQRNFESTFRAVQAAELQHRLKNKLSGKTCQSDPIPSTSGNGNQNNSKMRDHYPLYYGVKSYIHDFYNPPDKDVLNSGEFTQGDDFRFLAEPRQNDNCWVRMSIWIGVNLILLGIIAMAVGYLTPPREAIVGTVEGFTIVDRWAISFNHRLLVCQLTGLITLVCGAVIVVCAALVSCCQSVDPHPRSVLPTYYVIGATLLPETFVGSPSAASDSRLHAIPTSKTIKSVQPDSVCPEY